jgi:hypothetical protein
MYKFKKKKRKVKRLIFIIGTEKKKKKNALLYKKNYRIYIIMFKRKVVEHLTDFVLESKKENFFIKIKFRNLPSGQYGHLSLFCIDNLFNASFDIT